jgi:hypothetical protein
MDWTLSTYLEYKNWIDLIKDLVFFAGAYVFFKFLKNKKFTDVSEQIDKNLRFRRRIESELNDYVYKMYKRDIAIRFVHWKNYPWKLDHDGYSHFLFCRSFDNKTLPFGYIDNTGINFQEAVLLDSKSLYVDDNDIFFFDHKSKIIHGFREISDCIMVLHLPYQNIVNFDFRECIEHDPVFYIKYPYDKRRKLYDDQIIIREKHGTPFRHELSFKNMLHKYTPLRYLRLKIKAKVIHILSKKETDYE